MSNLKLPLEIRALNLCHLIILGADGREVAAAKSIYSVEAQHRAEIIVAALTRDQEEEAFSPAVCRAMARFCSGLADAKDQEKCKLRHWLLRCDNCGWIPHGLREPPDA